MKITQEQRDILLQEQQGEKKRYKLSEPQLLGIATGAISPAALNDDELVDFLELANLFYRAGYPLVSDDDYDFKFLSELKLRNPEHPYLTTVEPESTQSKTIELPTRMLSTEKAYDFVAIERWKSRVIKAAKELGKDPGSVEFRATPKLDGFAAFDDGKRLYTRGDGRKGSDISRVFDRGLQVAGGGDRGLGPGEIVVSRSYFETHLSSDFDNPRNFQASLIKEKELEAPAADAISFGAAVFYPFSELPQWKGGWEELEPRFDEIVEGLWRSVDYEIDGIVFEITDKGVREYMGATRHHHRWQIAYKKATEFLKVHVLNVTPQTSRSGRVNPVAEVEPTRLSGALIKRVTAHHYGMVREKGIGAGAVIELIRSGEVIPKIKDVVKGVTAHIPVACPSCKGDLGWDGDYLCCKNSMDCPAQIINSIEHFFNVLGNIDGFGQSTVKKLYDCGISSIIEIYNCTEEGFVDCGFGPKQSQNLVEQLERSLKEEIEDWRFLAAFGIHRMGMGNCEKLLGSYPLEKVFDLTEDEIISIKGFSGKIAAEMISGMERVYSLFSALVNLGFTLIRTPITVRQQFDTIFAGKLIVFTGSMTHGSRKEMEAEAKRLGSSVGKSITGKTDILVYGEKAGGTKLIKAEKLGVQMLSESEYLAALNS